MEATAVKATQQPAREVGAIVVYCTGVANLASGEWCGLSTRSSLLGGLLCKTSWNGCSIRQEAPADAKWDVGCKICVLALGVKKDERGESCTGWISYPQPGTLAMLQAHWGRRCSYSCQLALRQSEDILAIRLAQHILSQPLPKAWDERLWPDLSWLDFGSSPEGMKVSTEDGWDQSCSNNPKAKLIKELLRHSPHFINEARDKRR